jgi:acetyltransferase
VIVIFIPPILTQAEVVANVIRELAPEFRRRGKTLVASFMGSHGAGIEYDSEGSRYIPLFAFPERTAGALARAYEYSQWLRRPKGVIPKLTGINKEKAEEIVASALKQSSTRPLWLDASSISDLLNSYGIKVAASKSAKTAKDAVKVATEIGFPVAVKLLSDKITHKTEVGGVILSCCSSGDVQQAFNQIRERLESLGRADEMQGVTIQQMISEGIEVIVGLTQDSSFGSLIMFGMGGTYAEFLKDITFRIHPLTDVDIQDMVRSVKVHELFAGWRGSKPSDVKALEDLLLRVSAMVEDLPQIAEMDLNPVKVQEQGKGYVVVDARILLS